MSKKDKLINILLDREIFIESDKAKRVIMAGEIFVEQECELKPGAMVLKTAYIEYKPRRAKYVSRGGFKLEGAIEEFDLNLQDKVVLDIGSSTGGFTDCALQNGAKLVYALDVGTNQLAWKLRTHSKVKVLEKTNFRTVNTDIFTDVIDFICTDVSFISLSLLMPNITKLSSLDTEIVLLIKPQFETDKIDQLEKGILKDKNIHKEVIENCIKEALKNNLYLQKLTVSPIKGSKGNVEYLSLFKKNATTSLDINTLIDRVVSKG